MCLIINHFVTVTIMYYSNLQVNYMVTIFIRYLLLFRLLRLLSCSKCFVCLCLFQHRYCFLVGAVKSYIIATSDLCFFIHASNLLPKHGWVVLRQGFPERHSSEGDARFCLFDFLQQVKPWSWHVELFLELV